MTRGITRSRVIQVWVVAVALVLVAGIAFGASVTAGSGAMLLALCLVPPVIVLALWRGAPPPTVAELLYDADHPLAAENRSTHR